MSDQMVLGRLQGGGISAGWERLRGGDGDWRHTHEAAGGVPVDLGQPGLLRAWVLWTLVRIASMERREVV